MFWDFSYSPIYGLFLKIFHVHLRRMYILLILDGVFCLSVRCIWFILLFKSSISLLIFCMNILYIMERRGVEIPYYFWAAAFFSLQFCQCLLPIFECSDTDMCMYVHIFIIVISPWWTDPFVIIECPSLSLVTVSDIFYLSKYEYPCSLLVNMCSIPFSILSFLTCACP